MIYISTSCCTHCRIMCAKPHSADVEIIISANNCPKKLYIEIE